jgi:hydroxymethylpyrimidine pyrophosphatase-like HAD family hydrolase
MGGTFRRYNHIDTTKALGNRNLMKLTGGTVEDIIAFGDDYGDFDMLREAGVGVMMKNGRPELLGKTSHISEYTNDEDGVAKFLEKWFALK